MEQIFDVHIHAGKFDLLREDIQGLLTKFPYEDDVCVKEIFSQPAILKAYLQRDNVKGAIILAECGPGTNFSIDSELILDFCKDDDFFIPFGSVNPNYHKDPLAEWEKGTKAGVKGYKFYPADHVFNPFSDEMMEVYANCAANNQPIMFHTGLTAQKDTEQKHIKPQEYIWLAETFPDLVLMLAHGGKPTWYDDALAMAAKYENVYLDTSLVPPEDVKQWLAFSDDVHDKIFFGSDLPVSGAYSRVCERYRNAGFDPEVLTKLFTGNADRVLSKMFAKTSCEILEEV